jgi:hypothetical protein
MSIECIHENHTLYFGGSYDGAESLGYRDVAFNLRLRTAAAREFGVDTHICEVLLLLRPFAEIKVMEIVLQLLRRLDYMCNCNAFIAQFIHNLHLTQFTSKIHCK